MGGVEIGVEREKRRGVERDKRGWVIVDPLPLVSLSIYLSPTQNTCHLPALVWHLLDDAPGRDAEVILNKYIIRCIGIPHLLDDAPGRDA